MGAGQQHKHRTLGEKLLHQAQTKAVCYDTQRLCGCQPETSVGTCRACQPWTYFQLSVPAAKAFGAMAEPRKRSWLRDGVADLPDDGKRIPFSTLLAHHLRTRHFWCSLLVLAVIAIILACCRVDLQWYWLIIYAGEGLAFDICACTSHAEPDTDVLGIRSFYYTLCTVCA